jgi:CheY-like chemotaxis protein
VAGNRARDLVQQILAFSRQADQQLRPLRLKHVVKEALKLLRASFPANVDIVAQLESEAHVLVDPTQILQVIMNLGTNALQAMESTGGVLTVSLQGCAAPQAPFEADPTPHPWVELTVADTGAGMPPDIRARIFEPFFTTKPKGLGTGMGLALVHGIVKEMQGTITVTSKPGQGSAFRILLPVIDRQAADEAPEEETAGGGPEHIMLVDDEPAILKITARVLRGRGYAVTAHNDPHAALEALQDPSQHFDLVITDVTMPGIGGEVLARAALALLPGRPVILCTGFNYRVDSEAAAALGAAAFLRKPILKKDLLATVRRVLDAYRDTGRSTGGG